MAGDLLLLSRLSPPGQPRRCGQAFQGRRFACLFSRLRRLLSYRGRLEPRVNRDVFGSFDSEPYSISTNFQDGDLDVVGQNDLLVLFTTDD